MYGINPEDWLKFGAIGVVAFALFLNIALQRWTLGKTFKYIEGMLGGMKDVEVGLARIEAKIGIEDEPAQQAEG